MRNRYIDLGMKWWIVLAFALGLFSGISVATATVCEPAHDVETPAKTELPRLNQPAGRSVLATIGEFFTPEPCALLACSHISQPECSTRVTGEEPKGPGPHRIFLNADHSTRRLQETREAYPSSPEEVVKAFVATSYRLESMEGITNTGEVVERLKYYTDPSPGFGGFYVITGWTVATLCQKGGQSKVRARYHVLGVATKNEFSCERGQEIVDYTLIKIGGKWHIDGPRDPPTVSVASTIRIYRYWAATWPTEAATFGKNIRDLRRCLDQKPENIKENCHAVCP